LLAFSLSLSPSLQKKVKKKQKDGVTPMKPKHPKNEQKIFSVRFQYILQSKEKKKKKEKQKRKKEKKKKEKKKTQQL